MKRYLIGGIIGYLVTSTFDIPGPSSIFWWFVGLSCAIGAYVWFVWSRFDDDNLGDVDE